MVSKQHVTAKQLMVVVFFFATLFLLLGLFLSAVRPVNAQTSVSGTPTAGVSSTSMAGMPVTGSTSRNMIDLNQLQSFTVVDRDGNQIGTVNSFVMDLRNSSVCAATSGTSGSMTGMSATAVATGTVGGSVSATAAVPNTGGTFTGLQACKVTTGNQASGLISYVVVDRSGVASTNGTSNGTSSSVSSTAVATSSVSGSTSTTMANTSGNLVPVPWRFVRINLDQHTLIVDVTQNALNNAPSFSGTAPDLFGTDWQTNFSRFWNNTANVSTVGVPVTGSTSATAVSTATSAVAATVAPTETSAVMSTVAPTETSAVVSTVAPTETSAVVATVAPTETSAVVATGVATATSAVGVSTSVPATVQAPGVSGTPTALVPVTGVDLGQVQEAAAAQQRMLVDIGIVGVGLVLLALGIVIKTGKK